VGAYIIDALPTWVLIIIGGELAGCPGR